MQRFGGVLVLLFVFYSLGCARGESAEQRQLAELRDELARVQSERDRVEQRVSQLEVRAADPRAKAVSESVPASTPKLRVVRISPESSAPANEPAPPDSSEDRTSRASIHFVGDRSGIDTIEDPPPAAKQRGRRGDANARIHSAGASDEDGAPRARASASDPESRRAFDAAMGLYRGGQFSQARESFAAFVIRWPDHPNVESAMQLRGECYFREGDFTHAIEQFEGVLLRFPRAKSAPDTLLKTGLAYQKIGAADKARAAFDRLKRQYPRSEAVKRIALTETETETKSQ